MKDKLERLVENMINGNLSTAKEQAKRVPHFKIRQGFIDAGYSERKAILTADWLKGRDCWQEMYDAV